MLSRWLAALALAALALQPALAAAHGHSHEPSHEPRDHVLASHDHDHGHAHREIRHGAPGDHRNDGHAPGHDDDACALADFAGLTQCAAPAPDAVPAAVLTPAERPSWPQTAPPSARAARAHAIRGPPQPL